jgi:hypothetical protein
MTPSPPTPEAAEDEHTVDLDRTATVLTALLPLLRRLAEHAQDASS